MRRNQKQSQQSCFLSPPFHSSQMQDLQYSVHGAAASARFFQMAGTETTAAGFVDRRLRPHPQQSLKCPRCDSPNTKFCYYNNYNLSQPRHFCKSCRRYWTKGGVLRNVPVGGGCRKSSASRRSSSSSSSSSGANSSSSNASSPKTSSSSGSDTTATVTIPPPPPPPPLPPPPATVMEAPGIFEEANTTTHLMISPTGYNSFSDFYTLENINPPPLPPPLDVQDLRFMEETVGLDLHHPLLDGRSGGSDELTSIDWQGCLDATAGFFDPAAPVTAGIGDHGLFWSHNSSNSQPLFFHDR